MASEKGLTVVLPAFNEEEVIEEMVLHTDSAIKNLRVPYEIIVVDDGSSDNTLKFFRI